MQYLDYQFKARVELANVHHFDVLAGGVWKSSLPRMATLLFCQGTGRVLVVIKHNEIESYRRFVIKVSVVDKNLVRQALAHAPVSECPDLPACHAPPSRKPHSG